MKQAHFQMSRPASPGRTWQPTARFRRGFSLIEVLIVAAILSIIAGIGMINIQQVMDSNKRKATVGEARMLATAVGYAYEDVGIFPKLNYLLERVTPFYQGTGDGVINPATGLAYPGFDYIGTIQQNPPRHRSLSNRIAQTWNGPYQALSPTSQSSATGPSGFVEMEMPGRGGEIRRWPSDQYGRPYVMYLLELAPGEPDTFGNVRFLKDPTSQPDFAAAVVSYGPDGFPGLFRGQAGEGAIKLQQRLWVEVFPQRRYRMLQPTDYAMPAAQEKIRGYSEQRFSAVAGGRETWIGVIDGPLPDVTQTSITSDDVVIEF